MIVFIAKIEALEHLEFLVIGYFASDPLKPASYLWVYLLVNSTAISLGIFSAIGYIIRI